ncbi:hypothetical protein EVAR_31898_1 [Eumeta japonica]|uniref:Uncharacterized protein n=1 Tax=Eumeta variegata TaxID=151549 RepID=A0A4C1WVC2_EUMVA|nr:hypothetical protein EVAR_31898_1 [Eumeta japonica]
MNLLLRLRKCSSIDSMGLARSQANLNCSLFVLLVNEQGSDKTSQASSGVRVEERMIAIKINQKGDHKPDGKTLATLATSANAENHEPSSGQGNLGSTCNERLEVAFGRLSLHKRSRETLNSSRGLDDDVEEETLRDGKSSKPQIYVKILGVATNIKIVIAQTPHKLYTYNKIYREQSAQYNVIIMETVTALLPGACLRSRPCLLRHEPGLDCCRRRDIVKLLQFNREDSASDDDLASKSEEIYKNSTVRDIGTKIEIECGTKIRVKSVAEIGMRSGAEIIIENESGIEIRTRIEICLNRNRIQKQKRDHNWNLQRDGGNGDDN